MSERAWIYTKWDEFGKEGRAQRELKALDSFY
jgi:hypothetical protein